MTEIYDWLKNRLRETRPDLKLVLFTNGNSFMNPPLDDPHPLPSLLDYARRGGLDIKPFLDDPDVAVCHTVNTGSGIPGDCDISFRGTTAVVRRPPR